MAQKLKERIIDWVKKNDVTKFDWKGVALALSVPRGSATGRLCELTKAGTLCREGNQYRLRIQPQVRTRTSYFLLLDASTSMSGDNDHREDRRPKAAALANDTVAMVKKHGQDDDFNIGFFAGRSWWPQYSQMGVSSSYSVKGTGTALCDALILAIEAAKLRANPKVVLCFTDGENNTGNCSWAELKRAIAHAPEDLTIAILVPEGSKGHKLLIEVGIPAGNIRPWRTMEGARCETVASTQEFVEKRKQGVRSVKNYFRADLSRVTMTDFERDLTEVTSHIRRWLTTKETTIEALISEKTKSAYKPGTGFFEVMKREGRIMGDRQFLILEPNSGRCFADGKRTVRSVCGYPEGDVAIKPGNHAGFVLLCQSKSSAKDTFRARILPRGTQVVHWPAGR